MATGLKSWLLSNFSCRIQMISSLILEDYESWADVSTFCCFDSLLCCAPLNWFMETLWRKAFSKISLKSLTQQTSWMSENHTTSKCTSSFWYGWDSARTPPPSKHRHCCVPGSDAQIKKSSKRKTLKLALILSGYVCSTAPALRQSAANGWTGVRRKQRRVQPKGAAVTTQQRQ